MAVQVRLVSFEAWNITRFMFVTGKRREIAGASELITYLDRMWVRAALAELCEGFAKEWRIEEHPVELLSTDAGAARVLVREGKLARRLVTAVTLSALRQAPGLVYGAVGGPFTGWSPVSGGDLAELWSLPGPADEVVLVPMKPGAPDFAKQTTILLGDLFRVESRDVSAVHDAIATVYHDVTDLRASHPSLS